LRERAFWRFYGRVLLRVPGVFLNTAAVVGALILLAAAAALLLAGKALANDILGLHGFSPTWAIVPCGLLLLYGLANANYQEAKLLERPTNRTAQPAMPTQVIAQPGSTVYVLPGSNVVRLPEGPEPLQSQGTQTEPESGQ
jgi:hypothetical protein